ncbi:hypothetical protein TRFO_43206 [Tritrichomonas foetus]|uniref:SP-RING-type domain-containing protein n=1 Tax=Tritrichomonas foetus TaxID=1144522 RepID=A0A1J4KW73_9EUKA|nr:hypothetical protein TRFO_43206 [Tritrichomonas foetus]|eukprot:OHT13942.1 hypothetical protein TRFO_43206 [Tritrichomonas foetus]
MISRSNKRRSKSDEGVGERTKKTQMQHSKHSNIRQARMIYPFFMMQQSSVQNFPQSVSANFNRFNSFTSMPTSMQMCSSSLPQPCVTENGICFTLFPFRNDLNYQFSIQKSPFQRVYIVSQVPLLPISFALNRCPFININLPADVTGALINGTNLISFQQINSTQPILVSLFISPSMQLNELIEKVMNDFPHAAPFNAQINNGSMNSFQNNFTLNNNNLAIHNNIILQEQNLTIIDPLTNENISHPCRGCNCCHAQCFDLTSFLMKAIGENDWCCPICQNQLTFEELHRIKII